MTDPIRILWVARSLGPGGAERLLVAHAEKAGAGFEYHCAYPSSAKTHLIPELEAHGVVLHRLGSRVWPLEIRRLIEDLDIDVVHAHAPAVAAGARLAVRSIPRRRRPAMLYTEHNVWSAYHRHTRLANSLTMVLDDHVLTVSDEALHSLWAPYQRKAETVHHGVDGAALQAAAGDDPAGTRAELGLADDVPVALQVANFREGKAHEVALDAMALLRDRGVGVHLLLVGQGHREAEIARMIEARRLGETVTLLGYRDDVPRLMRASEVLVLSSDQEGLPVSIMEALYLGVPVVSTRVGGVPEMITDGVEGLLPPPRDPAALADAIARVVGDPDLHASLVAGARRRSVEFDSTAVTARIEACYSALASARLRPHAHQ